MRRASRLTKLATHYWSALGYRSAALAWRTNDMLARAAGKLRGLESADSTAFLKKPFSDGRLPLNALERLQSVIYSARDVKFCIDDHAPGYAFNRDARPGGTRLHHIGEKQTHAIAAAIDDIASQITRKLGSGWRVFNVRSWSLQSGTSRADDWHLDCFPRSTFKLMLYLSPVGREMGTTEVRYEDGTAAIVEGEAGTYLLFDPNTLWHRAIPPARPGIERTAIEVSLMRAAFTDQRLAYAGSNAAYPFMPWTARPLLN